MLEHPRAQGALAAPASRLSVSGEWAWRPSSCQVLSREPMGAGGPWASCWPCCGPVMSGNFISSVSNDPLTLCKSLWELVSQTATYDSVQFGCIFSEKRDLWEPMYHAPLQTVWARLRGVGGRHGRGPGHLPARGQGCHLPSTDGWQDSVRKDCVPCASKILTPLPLEADSAHESNDTSSPSKIAKISKSKSHPAHGQSPFLLVPLGWTGPYCITLVLRRAEGVHGCGSPVAGRRHYWLRGGVWVEGEVSACPPCLLLLFRCFLTGHFINRTWGQEDSRDMTQQKLRTPWPCRMRHMPGPCVQGAASFFFSHCCHRHLPRCGIDPHASPDTRFVRLWPSSPSLSVRSSESIPV